MADFEDEFEEEAQLEIEPAEETPETCRQFDQEAFIRKLRQKPQLPYEPNECGTTCPKKSYKDWTAPLEERLSLPTLSSLDVIKERIPFPKGCVPPLSLPTWHFLPLEKRIPYLTAGKDLIYYTRGKLGTKLHRPTVTYSVKDPLNMERVVGAPYNALHDPHVRSLLFNPDFHDRILQRGFVNERDQVLCSLKEFNKFRDYLRTLWCDQLSKEVESEDTFVKSEREQFRALMKAESATALKGKAAKVAAGIANARRYQMELAEFKRKKQKQRDEMSAERLKLWRQERERQIIEHIMQGIERARKNKERLETLYEERLQRRRDIMTKAIRKYLETDERRKNDKAMMQAAYNKFLMEWLESKYVFCYNKMLERRELQRDLRDSRKYRGRKRQQRIEAYRKAMPSIQEKRRAETARIWAIVRKFAMRWLGKVRQRLNAPKDVHHESCWLKDSKGVLEETLKYLYQESGYEKLDDFILHIMKLKKQIQAQIEMEEAQESALEAGEEEGDEEEGEAEIAADRGMDMEE